MGTPPCSSYTRLLLVEAVDHPISYPSFGARAAAPMIAICPDVIANGLQAAEVCQERKYDPTLLSTNKFYEKYVLPAGRS